MKVGDKRMWHKLPPTINPKALYIFLYEIFYHLFEDFEC
jgi:hypothetical protein